LTGRRSLIYYQFDVSRLNFVNQSIAPRTEALIYSTLNAYGREHGEELCGAWFVAAFAGLGRSAAAVRQALFRMVRNLELEARPAGRRTFYRLSGFGRAGVAVGTEKMFQAPEGDWDGRWTIVHYQFASRERMIRNRVRDLLETESFAALGPGLYLHPRDRTERVRAALAETKRREIEQGVAIFRADRVSGKSDAELVRQLWDVPALQRKYRDFVRAFAPLLERKRADWQPEEAFRTRLAAVLHYLEIAWDDPELPDSLLPADWHGHAARQVVAKLYQTLLPGTLRYGDQWQAINEVSR
jgi:phenylacetic acid degradation operon negative regulatory protein